MSSLKLSHSVFFLLWIVMHTVVGEQKCILLLQNRLFREDLKPVWISLFVSFILLLCCCFVLLLFRFVPLILFGDSYCVKVSEIEEWMISCLSDSIFISVIIT